MVTTSTAPVAPTAGLPSGGPSMQMPQPAPRDRRLVPFRVKLGILLGTVAALAVAVPTILSALTFVDDQERRVGEDNLELARIIGVLTERRIQQTFVTL